jgi:hypothetical protein
VDDFKEALDNGGAQISDSLLGGEGPGAFTLGFICMKKLLYYPHLDF